jgi:hypothetical protein
MRCTLFTRVSLWCDPWNRKSIWMLSIHDIYYSLCVCEVWDLGCMLHAEILASFQAQIMYRASISFSSSLAWLSWFLPKGFWFSYFCGWAFLMKPKLFWKIFGKNSSNDSFVIIYAKFLMRSQEKLYFRSSLAPLGIFAGAVSWMTVSQSFAWSRAAPEPLPSESFYAIDLIRHFFLLSPFKIHTTIVLGQIIWPNFTNYTTIYDIIK